MKAVKITAIVLGSILIIIFGLQLWLGGKVKRVIEKEGSSISGGIYKVDVGKVSVNLFNRSVKIKNIGVSGDTTTVEGRETPPMIISFAVNKIKASGIKLSMLWNPEDFDIRSLTLVTPQITIDSYEHKKSHTSQEKGSQALETTHKSVQEVAGASSEAAVAATNPGSDLLKDKPLSDNKNKKGPRNFSIRNFIVKDGNILLRQHQEEDMSEYLLQGLQLRVDGFSTDTTSAADRSLHWANLIYLFSEKFTYTSPDATNIISVDSILYDTKNDLFSITYIDLEPQYPKGRFAYENKKHSDWTKATAGPIKAHGIDIKSFAEQNILKIDSITLASAEIESYKDRNAPQNPDPRSIVYESVQRLPIEVDVRTAHFKDVTATYWELPQFATEPGVITFTGLNGEFKGLSNIPSEDDPYYTLVARGNMYGVGASHATFYFPKDSLTNRFEVMGGLGSMNLSVANKMFVPLMNVQITSGTVNKMSFHIVGSSQSTAVDMDFLYSGLEVALLKNKSDEIKRRKFLSWIINEVIIKDSNPDQNGTRHGSGTAVRNYQRSQFNYLWKSLMPGIESTIK